MKEFIALIKKYKTQIILGALLFLAVLFGINQTVAKRNVMRQNDNNIVALTDSIHYYQGKNGELIAEKTLLLGDMHTLELANADLAQTIEDMKLHNPQQVVYIETEIINEVHDTTWMIEPNDTLIQKAFDFSNQWRVLNGSIKLQENNLSLNIDNDKVFANYTLAIKDNKVYLTSDNPYVQYNEIQGITLPKTKKNFSLGVGPTISYGYDFQHKNFVPVVGVSVGLYYNFLQF